MQPNQRLAGLPVSDGEIGIRYVHSFAYTRSTLAAKALAL